MFSFPDWYSICSWRFKFAVILYFDVRFLHPTKGSVFFYFLPSYQHLELRRGNSLRPRKVDQDKFYIDAESFAYIHSFCTDYSEKYRQRYSHRYYTVWNPQFATGWQSVQPRQQLLWGSSSVKSLEQNDPVCLSCFNSPFLLTDASSMILKFLKQHVIKQNTVFIGWVKGRSFPVFKLRIASTGY